MRHESKSAISASILPDPVLCTVDVVVLTLVEGRLHVVLVDRESEPFRGVAALPGGFVHPAEDPDLRRTAQRVLREKAGIDEPYLEELGTFSGPGRDPRGWSVSVAWVTLVASERSRPDGRARVRLRSVDDVDGLPFDHPAIVRAARERVRSKSSYSSLPAHLCPEEFTLPRLQAVYETLLGEPVNKVSFRRKMVELDFLEPVQGGKLQGGAHRPAQLWRLKAPFRSVLSLTDRGINSGG